MDKKITVDEKLADELRRVAGNDAVHMGEPLSEHTTFKIGGPAECFVCPRTIEQITAVVAAVRSRDDVPLRILGLGSDLLVADEGLAGVILHLGDNFADISIEDTRLIAQAGASNEAIARAACAAGLAGYEFASGIPGSVGGAAIMNAGAYDGEFKDVCVGVTCLTPSGSVIEVPAQEADWSYRHSMMSDEGYIILAATLQLHADETAAIQARIDDLTERRASKQPLELPSAGSTFKRPVGHYAGPLIQEAGMQGARVGAAQVSTKHAGFVVNTGGATAADVAGLIRKVQDAVLEHSGVQLEPEVRFWQ